MSAVSAVSVFLCFCHVRATLGCALQVREELDAPLRQLREAARRVAEIKVESGIVTEVEEYVSSFRPDLMVRAVDARGTMRGGSWIVHAFPLPSARSTRPDRRRYNFAARNTVIMTDTAFVVWPAIWLCVIVCQSVCGWALAMSFAWHA